MSILLGRKAKINLEENSIYLILFTHNTFVNQMVRQVCREIWFVTNFVCYLLTDGNCNVMYQFNFTVNNLLSLRFAFLLRKLNFGHYSRCLASEE